MSMVGSKSKKIILRAFAAAFAVMMLLSSCIALAGCSSKGKSESNAYVEITSGGKKISMKAPVSNDKRDIYLFAIDPWQSTSDVVDLEPLVKAKVKNREAKASFKVDGMSLDELLCKGYVFAMEGSDGLGYEPVSGVYYITNSKDVHKDADEIDETKLDGNIKGLIGTPSQLLELGARSTLVTADLGKLLRGTGGAGALSLVWNGVSCHVDKLELEKLDAQIKAYTAAGIAVYLEIVQTKSPDELEEEIKDIAFAGASDSEGYALNMRSRDGSNKICAVLNLLAERYSGGEYGRADSFIIGRTVNNYGKYYADTLSKEESVENYAMAVRMAYNLVMKHNPEGSVYISLGNNWTVAGNNSFSAKEILTLFANMAEGGGDFYWQVCMEANASNASNSAIWQDPAVTESAQFISPIDLTTLTSLLSTAAYKYNGFERNIMLNRFAIGGSDQDKQAASYAYAYYKALESGKVNALIYEKAIDSIDDPIESGLYRSDASALPKEKKLATIFEAVDNYKIGDTAYISGLIGESWNRLYESLKKEAIEREVTYGEHSSDHSRDELSVIADFKNGSLNGFTPISADYAELKYSEVWEKPALYASLAPGFSGDMSGVIMNDIPFDQIKKAGYLTMTAKIEKADAMSDNIGIFVRIAGRDKNGDEHVYFAKDEIRAGEWIELYYNIEEYIEHLDCETVSLSIMAGALDADSEVEGLWISKVTAEAPDDKDFPIALVIWIAAGVLIAAGLVVFVIWFKKNYTFVRE